MLLRGQVVTMELRVIFLGYMQQLGLDMTVVLRIPVLTHQHLCIQRGSWVLKRRLLVIWGNSSCTAKGG